MSAPSSRTRPVEDRYRLAGATLDGRVAVERAVARGGFGVVYRGFHLGLRAPVAVKVLHLPDEYSEAVKVEFRQRFVQEARLVYQLAHPAIVRLLDHGVSAMPTGELVPWMVLEWLDGVTLGHVIRGRPPGAPFTPREAMALLRPVFEALAMVHARGVAHRDITPANIFVCPTPEGPAARLIDFGVARVMEAHDSPGTGHTATQSSVTAFSKAYAAPEQLGHTRTGPWTDVHALALVLTEMLTRRPAYEGADAAELLGAAVSPSRPTPASKGVDVGALEPVLARAMALRPAERFATAAELLAALDEALVAPPPKRPRSAAATAAWWLGGALVVGAVAGVALARGHRDSHAPAAPAPAISARPAPEPVAPRAAPSERPPLPPAVVQQVAPNIAQVFAPPPPRPQPAARRRRDAPRVNGETIRSNPFATH